MERNIRVGRILALVMPLLTVITNLGLVAVIWFGGVDVVNGQFTIGELVAFNNYLMIGMAPVLLLGNMVTMASTRRSLGGAGAGSVRHQTAESRRRERLSPRPDAGASRL